MSCGNTPAFGGLPRRWGMALALLCVALLGVEARHIASTLPYPLHVDEGFVSGPARRNLVEGNLHPYRFNHPSLPKYLAAIGMAGGFLSSASKLEARMIHHLGNVGYPYYDLPRAMRVARLLFLLLAVAAVAATGALAWSAFGRPSTVLMAPLALATTPLFVYHSWAYLNVDIIGALFVVLAMVAVLRGTREPSVYQSAILPGVFVGLAIGSKYTLAIAMLPIVLGIGLFYPSGRRMSVIAAAAGAMIAAFLLAVPYSLIDIPGFLNGVAEEAFHYTRGHPGNEAEPGWPQVLFYGRHFLSEFGVPGALLACIGLAAWTWNDWRRAVIVASVPLVLLVLVVSQRVHFARNVLSAYPAVALFVARGAIPVFRWMRQFLGRRGVQSRAGAIAGILLLLAVVPPKHLFGLLRDRTDSRNVARAWIAGNVPAGWALVVPAQLELDPRPIEESGRTVTVVDLAPSASREVIEQALLAGPRPAVVLWPQWAVSLDVVTDDRVATLNRVTEGRRVLREFGTNPVLIGFTHRVPWGDPRFSVAVLRGGP